MFKKREDRIESTERKLYSHDDSFLKRRKDVHLSPRKNEEDYEWKDDFKKKKSKKSKGFPFWFFLFSIVFFFSSIIAAIYMFYSGLNAAFSENVLISFSAPQPVSPSEPTTFQVVVSNENQSSLEDVRLIVTFPFGSRQAEDPSQPVGRIVRDLGSVGAGQSLNQTYEVIIFGEEKSYKKINVSLDYRPSGSGAYFQKSKDFEIELGPSLLSLEVKSSKEVLDPGEEVEFTIDLSSKSSSLMSGVLVKADFPSGFRMIEATPEPYLDNNVWNIGDLQPEGEKKIIIKGLMQAEQGDKRVFNFEAGIRDVDNTGRIGVLLTAKSKEININVSAISLEALVDGRAVFEHVSSPGREVRLDLLWVNNSGKELNDIKVEARFRGDMLDSGSVVAETGDFRVNERVVIWDKSTDQSLAQARQGQGGNLSLRFATLSALSEQSLAANSSLFIDIIIQATDLSQPAGLRTVRSETTRSIRLSSTLNLNATLVRTIGPFENYGPIPPRVNQPSSYTVVWNVSNSSNKIEGAEVSTTLPSYVSFSGAVHPEGAAVSFDPLSRKVVWKVGEIDVGAGGVSSKEVAFQVEFRPTIAQLNTIPEIILSSILTGVDSFTSAELSDSRGPLNTNLSTDPNVEEGHGRVTN